jgi:hypothetical protein
MKAIQNAVFLVSYNQKQEFMMFSNNGIAYYVVLM